MRTISHGAGQISRRALLAGAGATMGLSGLAHAAASPRRNLVILWVAGGWDCTFALDPKPGLVGVDTPADGTVAAYGGMDVLTSAERPAVQAYFDAWWDRTALVRGINALSISHEACSTRMLTGTRSPRSPDLGAITGHSTGADLPIPYLIFGDWAYAGPYAASTGRTGTTNQLRTLLDPTLAYPAADAAVERFVATDAERGLIGDYVRARAERELAVRGSQGYNRGRVQDFLTAMDRVEVLRPEAAVFGAAAETVSLQAQVDLAVAALARGISRSVMIDTRFRWDTHSRNSLQSTYHEGLFASLGQLADALATTPGAVGGSLLDETVVAVLSDMGRTPLLNGQEADAGKDHWPFTTALLLGAGVAGGRVCGGTDDAMLGGAVDLDTGALSPSGTGLNPEHLLAGVLELVGVDPAPHLAVPPLRGFRA